MNDITLGNIESFRLDNQLTAYICINRKAPIASFQAWVATGSMHEQELSGSGVSHFLEHMVFKGSKNYTKDQITQIIDSIGGRINAYTSYTNTTYYVNAPSAKIATAAKIIIDMIKNPLLPEDEFQTEKDVIIREIKMRADIPEVRLFENMLQIMFKENPLRHPIIGYQHIFKSLTREQMFSYHKNRYQPENIYFVISGDVNPEDIFKLIEDECGNWENNSFRNLIIPNEKKQLAPRTSTIFFKDPLARIAKAYHTPPLSDQLSPACDILGIILGGNESSRLITRLERKSQLAVSVDCSHHASPTGGILCASASCQPEKIDELEKVMLDELASIASSNPPEQREIDRVVNQISVDFIKSLRSIDIVASLIGRSVLYYSDPSYALKYLEIIKKITPEDISEAAKSCILNENSTTVKMLPPEVKKIFIQTSPKAASVEDIKIENIPDLPRILKYKDSSLPLFDITLVSISPCLFEDTSTAGISELISETLPCGTKNRSEDELNQILDDNAIDFSVNSGKNSMTTSISSENNRFDLALELLCEILREPAFAAEIIEREKINLIEEIKSSRLSVRKAASEKIYKILYQNHPYGIDSEQAINSLSKLSDKDLIGFYTKNCLQFKNTIAAISGNFTEEQYEKFISAMNTVQWRKEDNTLPSAPPPPSGKIREQIFVPREQSLVSVTIPSCDFRSDKKFSIMMLSAAVNSMNSQLFKRIRDQHGMAYYTGMSAFHGVSSGHISFYAGVSAENIDKTMQIIYEEIERMISASPLSSEEFNSAKEKILFGIAESYMTPNERAASAAAEELLGLGCETYKQLYNTFLNIDPAKVSADISETLSKPTKIEVIVNSAK